MAERQSVRMARGWEAATACRVMAMAAWKVKVTSLINSAFSRDPLNHDGLDLTNVVKKLTIVDDGDRAARVNHPREKVKQSTGSRVCCDKRDVVHC
eukprot:296006-Rhodomonas_salina.3